MEMAMADFPAFEFFVKMEYYESGNLSNAQGTQPLQEPFSFPLLPQGTRNKLDVIKLTAQFVAVFGLDIHKDLIDSVLMNPELVPLFQFTEKIDNRYVFYSQLALGYARVLLRAEKPRKKDVIVERFSSLVCQVLKTAHDGYH
ncbi:hypothetical protein V5N11_018083 [Cardamine amara subsp. amara]|uniref:SURP motif domain-containing protein n=1 Tax=Cardamine amara subsp. amara TaxID=228776 RepID=A0ABD1B4L9_CARAN